MKVEAATQILRKFSDTQMMSEFDSDFFGGNQTSKVVGVESFSIVIRALCKLKIGQADALSLYHKMKDLNL